MRVSHVPVRRRALPWCAPAPCFLRSEPADSCSAPTIVPNTAGNPRQGRDNPVVIRRRALASLLVCSAAWLPVRLAYPADSWLGIALRLGLRRVGALRAAADAVGLCSCLFAGPLLMAHVDSLHGASMSLRSSAEWWRNIVVVCTHAGRAVAQTMGLLTHSHPPAGASHRGVFLPGVHVPTAAQERLERSSGHCRMPALLRCAREPNAIDPKRDPPHALAPHPQRHARQVLRTCTTSGSCAASGGCRGARPSCRSAARWCTPRCSARLQRISCCARATWQLPSQHTCFATSKGYPGSAACGIMSSGGSCVPPWAPASRCLLLCCRKCEQSMIMLAYSYQTSSRSALRLCGAVRALRGCRLARPRGSGRCCWSAGLDSKPSWPRGSS